jgi:hypothetical protein
LTKPKWDIRHETRAWHKDEAWQRFELIPEKFEMIQGQAHLPDEVRENLPCLLLEFVGTDRAVQFGNPEVWRAAVANLRD